MDVDADRDKMSLSDRLSLMEGSVRMQSLELKRTKRLFLREKHDLQEDLARKSARVSSSFR